MKQRRKGLNPISRTHHWMCRFRESGTSVRYFLPIILLLGFSLRPAIAKSQSVLGIYNSQLRQLFSTVNNPNAQVNFLYDMSSHVADSSFFNDYVQDTSNVDNWYNIYREMYNGAYDTTKFISADSVFNLALPQIQTDTIPVGIINWDFNLLKPTALTTSTWFNYDTVNDVLTDQPAAPSSPYTVNTTFAASTLRVDAPYTNPVFMVNPLYIFKDSVKVFDAENILKIDFGDGNGWITFNGNTVSYHQAHYATPGDVVIQYAIFDYFGNIKQYCKSAFRTAGGDEIPPDSTIHLNGLEVSFYGGCQANAEKKYVIYLEGIDILGDRHAPSIYADMIRDSRIIDLKNFGYTFVVVDWKNSYAPLKDNAMHVVELLEQLKCGFIIRDFDHVPPPFVVIGESMGGLIGRYALTYMETPQYAHTGCRPEYMHNTRLLMTLDAPHQGANIPIGVQHLYRNLAQLGLPISPFVSGTNRQYLHLLDGSAKEMLLYHVSTDQYPLLPTSTSTYTTSSDKQTFDADLKSIGNYPKYCKLDAISNGSWRGFPQVREWDGSNRVPNDRMMDVQTDVYLRVLGIKIVGSTLKMQVRTNPNGTGRVFYVNHGISHWKIKLKWFGVKLVWWNSYVTMIDKSAKDVLPYCTSAGSYFIDNYIGIGPASHKSLNVFDIFGYGTSNNGMGQVTLHANIGCAFFSSTNLSFTAYSDGTSFGFMPTQSSFDSRPALPLDHDFIKDGPALAMSRSPFDVAFTNAYKYAGVWSYTNLYHITMFNPPLNECKTCVVSNPDSVYSYMLNREIGDDSMFVENLSANFKMTLESERDIMVNHRNHYYNYGSQLAMINGWRDNTYYFTYPPETAIVFSKERPFKVVNTYPTTFRTNYTFNMNPAQPITGPYQFVHGAMQICCIRYHQKSASPPVAQLAAAPKKVFELYPNPVGDGFMTVKYQLPTTKPVTIYLYNNVGRQIGIFHPTFEDNSIMSYYPINLSSLALSPGVYYLRLTDGKESMNASFVVSH